MRYLIVSEKDGIYLGNCLGLGFWSKLDAAGQNAAVTFPSKNECIEHIKSWVGFNGELSDPENFDLVPIEGLEGIYATVEDCIKVGLEGWSPNE